MGFFNSLPVPESSKVIPAHPCFEPFGEGKVFALQCWLTASPPPSGFFVTKVLQPSFKTAAFSGDDERETREMVGKCPEKRQIQIKKALQPHFYDSSKLLCVLCQYANMIKGNGIKIKNIAKGTTDPRVKFLSQVLTKISNFNFRISIKH